MSITEKPKEMTTEHEHEWWPTYSACFDVDDAVWLVVRFACIKMDDCRAERIDAKEAVEV